MCLKQKISNPLFFASNLLIGLAINLTSAAPGPPHPLDPPLWPGGAPLYTPLRILAEQGNRMYND